MEGRGGGEAGVQGVNSASLVTPPSTFLLSPLFLHLSLSNFIQNCPIFPYFGSFFFVYFSYYDALMQADVNGHYALNRP